MENWNTTPNPTEVRISITDAAGNNVEGWLNHVLGMSQLYGNGGIFEFHVNDTKFMLFSITTAHISLVYKTFWLFEGTKVGYGNVNPQPNDLVTVTFIPKAKMVLIGTPGTDGTPGTNGIPGQMVQMEQMVL